MDARKVTGVSNGSDGNSLESSQEWLQFMESSKLMIKTLLVNNPELEQFNFNDKITKLYNYNVMGGKHSRGILVVMAVELLAKHLDIKITEEDVNIANMCGWAVEILQAFGIVLDDTMDNAITRRGQPCWYKIVGLSAINDGLMLEQHVYCILREFTSNKPYYLKLIESVRQVVILTLNGQFLDVPVLQKDGRPDLKCYTLSRMNTIHKYKTAFYTFVLPVKIAMILISIESEDEFKNMEEILLKIGLMFQLNDDYLDLYGDTELTGKIGTDIEEGKCCWPIVTALELCDKTQLNILQNNYGIKSEESVSAVKEVYNQLNLPEVYKKVIDGMYVNIMIDIDKLKTKSKLNPKLFTYILNKNYRRSK